jgi:acid stress chaperone HdeB
MVFRIIASAIVPVAFSIAPAQAQVTLDVSKITCEQYYLAKVVHPNSVAIWLSGFYNGKRNNTILDVERVKASAYKIRSYCRDNFQTTMVEAVEKVLGPSQ